MVYFDVRGVVPAAKGDDRENEGGRSRGVGNLHGGDAEGEERAVYGSTTRGVQKEGKKKSSRGMCI